MLGYVHWGGLRKLITGKDHNVTIIDKDLAWSILAVRNVIILTYSRSHLSSWASRLAHTLLTGKKAQYSHALLNVEPNGVIFELIEAISKGVVISSFGEVFSCDGFCILVPRRYVQSQYDGAVWDFRKEIGKPYDDYFKLNDDKARSCIELVFSKLEKLPEWQEKMPVLDYMIKEEKNLTPQMLRDCPDFEVLLEVRR